MSARTMRLGLSIRGHGYHPAAWRHPDVPAAGTLDVRHYVRSAQIAERGRLDRVFFAGGARDADQPHPGHQHRAHRRAPRRIRRRQRAAADIVGDQRGAARVDAVGFRHGYLS
jgi:hypothetical protein